MEENETPFNNRLINHRKDAESQASLSKCKHFSEQNRNFQQHAEFALIQQIEKQSTAEEGRTLLKQRENFWVLKLKILCPDGSNQELNIMKLLVLLLRNTSLSNDAFLADWNDKQSVGNLISDVKFEI